MRGSTDVSTDLVGERLLQVVYGTEERARRFYDTQLLDHLNHAMREFVGRQEMMFVATADRGGNCDATFRAGPPGFVVVLNEGQLAWPEYRGNGVMAGLGNISTNRHAGLLFVDFQELIGLHVNGRATIVENGEMRDAYPWVDDAGRAPERWVRLDVDEAFIHCRKHIPRMVKVPRDRNWGTDNVRSKGGDYFDAARDRDPGAPPPAPDTGPRRWWHRLRI
ncbi:pyridoxamine 5'-phosphate oxidase family protein [Asanoa sp. WMMD1127]|uniref:pyridoxamine 5'-phosphate oxidase family protein n=1 Tax=Asanoa sp. WMMD1127 TaxID=3016107 RepID=UPI002416DFD7|nr:pyridoxamine 5'-phosphate oxidase family protein [Asanoa sp. WMMD1127]MDG4824685.1 pyridoxamine 5'-phosphate oxidase family protein [Asanoa sp. WMMD1127]